jgi:hypothetical protein
VATNKHNTTKKHNDPKEVNQTKEFIFGCIVRASRVRSLAHHHFYFLENDERKW